MHHTTDTLPGVWTELAYRRPPPSPEFLSTPINLFSHAETYRDVRKVLVRDIRCGGGTRHTLEKDGLEFIKHAVDIKDWEDDSEVRKVLKSETTKLVKER